jgi:hypothetical protein
LIEKPSDLRIYSNFVEQLIKPNVVQQAINELIDDDY